MLPIDLKESLQNDFKQYILNSWQRVANIEPIGWGTCPPVPVGGPGPLYAGVRVRVLAGTTTAPASFVGRRPDGGNELDWYPYFQSSAGARAKADAIHEFGHTLGFFHEHSRFDAPATCGAGETDFRNPSNKAPGPYVTVGPVDNNSMMSYCNPNYFQGVLSHFDVRGARDAYGSRRTGLGVYNRSTGHWYVDRNDSFGWDGPPNDLYFQYGTNGSYPVSSTGYFDPVVGYYANGTWRIDSGEPRRALGLNDAQYSFGLAGQVPVLGYWQGRQSYSRLGIFDAQTAQWALDMNNNAVWDGVPTDRLCSFGAAGDKPAAGNFHGTPTDVDVIGTFRNGRWYIDRDNSCGWTGALDRIYDFGQAGDIPVPGDYDGDGKDNLAVFRPSQAIWYVDWDDSLGWSSVDGGIQFGQSTDWPVAMRKQ